jgi:hypothetical protein
MVLHADELGPAILFCYELHLRKLYSPHGACADVVHLAGPDQIVQRLHCLLNRGMRIESMDLQKIDVVGIEAPERSMDLIEDGLAREPTLVCVVSKLRQLLAILDCPQTWVFTSVTVALCEDDELVARQLVLVDRFANDLFRDTVGVYISYASVLAVEPTAYDDMRHASIPSSDSSIVCSLQQRQRLFLFNDPGLPFGRTDAHCTQDGYRNSQAALSQATVFSPRLLEETLDIQLVRHGCDGVNCGETCDQRGVPRTYSGGSHSQRRIMSL